MSKTTTVLALALAAVPMLGTDSSALAETRRVASSPALESAVARAQPGDVILVAAGEYSVNLDIQHDGSAERPITLKAATPRSTVVLSARDDRRRVIELTGASHWRFEHLQLRGTRHAVMQITGGTDVVVRGCEISDSSKKGIIANGDRITIEQSTFRDIRQPVGGEDTQGIAAWAASRLTIRDNLFETPGDGVLIGGAGALSRTSTDVRIYRNHFHVKPDWTGKWHVENGIDVKNADGVVIADNVFHGYHGHADDDPMGCAIGVVTRDPEVSGRIARVRIERNTIYDVNRGLAAHGADGPGTDLVVRGNVFASILDANGPDAKPPAGVHLGDWTGATIERNTFVDVEHAVVHTHGELEGFAFRDNVLRRSAGLLRGASGGVVERICGDRAVDGVDQLVEDPRFVDEAGRDYRLAPDSPCRGKGARSETSSDAMMPDEGEAPAPENDDGRPVDWAKDNAAPITEVTPEEDLGPPITAGTEPADGEALDEEPAPPARIAEFGEETEEQEIRTEARAAKATPEEEPAPTLAAANVAGATKSDVADRRRARRGGCATVLTGGSVAGGAAAAFVLLLGGAAVVHATVRRRRQAP